MFVKEIETNIKIEAMEETVTISDDKIQSLRNHIETRNVSIHEEFATQNEHTHRLEYWKNKYLIELYSVLKSKFFNKNEDDYLTPSDVRLSDIKDYLNQRVVMFEKYQQSRGYKLENEDDVEACEITYEAKLLIEEHIDTDISVQEEIVADISEKSVEPSIGKPVKNKDPKKLELDDYNSLTIKDKIVKLYSDILVKASEKDGEDEGLIHTYITTMFDPETTTIDESNLFLNLSVINNILTHTNLSWDFETSLRVSQENIYLSDDKHKTILESDNDSVTKYALIAEKKILQLLNVYCLNQLVEHGDTKTVNIDEYKMAKITDNIGTIDAAEFYKEKLFKIADPKASIYITKDLEEILKDDISYNAYTNTTNDEIIQYLGKLNSRDIYLFHHGKIPKWEKAENIALVMNDGNKMVINPEKPLVYMNVIENPMIENPIIYMFYSMQMEFHQSRACRYQVFDGYFETF
jgi:hypothetical protein